MEDLFKIEHVTMSRIIIRISLYITQFKLKIKDRDNDYYIVDSTVLRIDKGKNKETYSEYKYLMSKIGKNIEILGDKAYNGLHEYKVNIPIKRNEVKYKLNIS